MKTNNIILFKILGVILFTLVGCAKVYYPEKYKPITQAHKTLAILPINFDLKTDLNNQQPYMDNYPVDQHFGLAFRNKLVEKLKKESLSIEIIDLKTIINILQNELKMAKKNSPLTKSLKLPMI